MSYYHGYMVLNQSNELHHSRPHPFFHMVQPLASPQFILIILIKFQIISPIYVATSMP